MMTGSAIATEWETANIPAILNAWYGGQDAGTAIADVLLGDYNPSGKLPVTFYAKDSDLPPFNSYEMKNRTYRYFDGEVLYPFGYGLSYTQFEYGQLQMPATVNAGDEATVTVNVKNIGKQDGEEVVQLYMSYPESREQTPLFALKGFERISLKAGESKNVTFRLSAKEFALSDTEGVLKITQGKRNIYIGGTSPSKTKAQKLPVVEKEINITGKEYTVRN